MLVAQTPRDPTSIRDVLTLDPAIGTLQGPIGFAQHFEKLGADERS